MKQTEFKVGDARTPVRAVNFAGNQVAHFKRMCVRLIQPHGWVVSATYLEQQDTTRVEFTNLAPAARPLWEMGQWADPQTGMPRRVA